MVSTCFIAIINQSRNIYLHMSVSPPINFTEDLYLEGEEGSISLVAIPPLSYSQPTKQISVFDASAGSSGVVNTGFQTFSGRKTFSSLPSCAWMPSSGSDLSNKAYVDSLVSASLTWKRSVIAFYDFALGDPAGVAVGDRYIARYSSGPFIENFIYEWNGTDWLEFATLEGWALYVSGDTSPLFANQCIMFDSTGNWISFSGTMTHSALLGLNADDHPQYVKVNGRTGDIVVMTNPLDALSHEDGSLQLLGGMSVEKNVVVHSGSVSVGVDPTYGIPITAHCTGNPQLRLQSTDGMTTLYCPFTVGSTSAGGLNIHPHGGYAGGAAMNAIGLGTAGQSYSVVTIHSTAPSTSSGTGGLLVSGGLGVKGQTTNASNMVFEGYRYVQMDGGNSYAYLQTDYSQFGDGVSLQYNQHGTGSAVAIDVAAGATSRLHCGYGTVALKVGAPNVAASDGLTVSTTYVTLYKPLTGGNQAQEVTTNWLYVTSETLRSLCTCRGSER